MAFFGLFKSKASPPAGVSSREPSVTGATSSSPVDFAALASAIKRQEPGAQEAFWNGVFRLPALSFYCSKPMAQIIAENDPAPPLFIAVVDGRPMLHAFTDAARAGAFGKARHEYFGQPADGITHISLSTESAIEYLLRLPPEVEALLINEEVFGARDNIVWLYAISRGLTITEACARIGIPAWGPLTHRFNATTDLAHLDELLAYALRQKFWYTLRKDGEKLPIMLERKNGDAPWLLFATDKQVAGQLGHLNPGQGHDLLEATPLAALTLMRDQAHRGGGNALMYHSSGTFALLFERTALVAAELGLI